MLVVAMSHLGMGSITALFCWHGLPWDKVHAIFHIKRMEILAGKLSPCAPETLACRNALYLTSVPS